MNWIEISSCCLMYAFARSKSVEICSLFLWFGLLLSNLIALNEQTLFYPFAFRGFSFKIRRCVLMDELKNQETKLTVFLSVSCRKMSDQKKNKVYSFSFCFELSFQKWSLWWMKRNDREQKYVLFLSFLCFHLLSKRIAKMSDEEQEFGTLNCILSRKKIED